MVEGIGPIPQNLRSSQHVFLMLLVELILVRRRWFGAELGLLDVPLAPLVPQLRMVAEALDALLDHSLEVVRVENVLQQARRADDCADCYKAGCKRYLIAKCENGFVPPLGRCFKLNCRPNKPIVIQVVANNQAWSLSWLGYTAYCAASSAKCTDRLAIRVLNVVRLPHRAAHIPKVFGNRLVRLKYVANVLQQAFGGSLIIAKQNR